MRIVRLDQGWSVLRPSVEGRMCLQRLALRCGYRLCEICTELGCGERYFHEVFIRDIGLTPKEWMRWERMVVARRMLTGGKPQEVVAMDLGFACANNFRREFLQIYRVAPLQFQRERWREANIEPRNSNIEH